MSSTPLMPKATAVWLVDNTSLTFEQIAEFCGLHVLEVKGIADGDVASGIKGLDPISSGQLTRDEIKRGQADSGYNLKLLKSKVEMPKIKTKKKPKYTPVSRRQDRPNAILWLLRHHVELKDSQIMRLVGTTKPTIQSIRDRTHWNSANLQPADPVTIGLCTQLDLDREVQKAAKHAQRTQETSEKESIKAGTLLPTEETVVSAPKTEEDDIIDFQKSANEVDTSDVFAEDMHTEKVSSEEEDVLDADEVFANLDTKTQNTAE